MPTSRICLNCGEPFAPVTHDHAYCSVQCRKTFNRRREKRGAELYDLAMIWRVTRGDEGGAAMKLMSEMIRRFREDDRRENRARSWLTLRERSDTLLKYKTAKLRRQPRD